MNDCKLIRFEPTPEMTEAAEKAYMPFGDMELALRMAILAAPDVQEEPVAFCEDAALSIAERTFSMEVDEQLASDIIQYAGRLHSLYAAPKPVEQPSPDVSGLVEALNVVKTVLESDDPAIADTVWVPGAPETLLDHVCAALDAYRKQGGEA